MSTASGCMRNRSRECVGDTKKGTETSCKGSQSNQAHTCLCPSKFSFQLFLSFPTLIFFFNISIVSYLFIQFI